MCRSHQNTLRRGFPADARTIGRSIVPLGNSIVLLGRSTPPRKNIRGRATPHPASSRRFREPNRDAALSHLPPDFRRSKRSTETSSSTDDERASSTFYNSSGSRHQMSDRIANSDICRRACRRAFIRLADRWAERPRVPYHAHPASTNPTRVRRHSPYQSSCYAHARSRDFRTSRQND